jgi:hypothetical protein
MIPATFLHIGSASSATTALCCRCQAALKVNASVQRHHYDKTMPGSTKGSRPMKDAFVRKGGCES